MISLRAENLLEQRVPCALVVDLEMSNAQLQTVLALFGSDILREVNLLPRE